jgi:cytochrome c551
MTNSIRPRTMLRGLLLAGCILAASGCGGNDSATPAGDAALTPEARELFADSCGSCHALEDAQTRGGFGPGLDGRSLDAERVRTQIERGGGAMPAAILDGEEADLVSEYVAAASSR